MFFEIVGYSHIWINLAYTWVAQKPTNTPISLDPWQQYAWFLLPLQMPTKLADTWVAQEPNEYTHFSQYAWCLLPLQMPTKLAHTWMTQKPNEYTYFFWTMTTTCMASLITPSGSETNRYMGGPRVNE